jgi:hypothetical protein
VLFLEPGARSGLILHAVIGASLVASATHLVLWTRTWWRGDFRRFVAARRFTTIVFCLYAAQFTLGNLIYPVYKVRVRAEYLDEPAAQRADLSGKQIGRDDVARRTGHESTTLHSTRDLGRVARTFDVKEHWIALGLALSAAMLLVAWSWDPKRDTEPTAHMPGRLIFVLSVCVALCAWIGALAGLYVTSFRAI